jgi:tetratricopeptide (TPR) repeat protein
MTTRLLALWVAVMAGVVVASAIGKPFVPNGDDVVVERLPEQGDLALKELKRMRAALATDPRNLDTAAGVARRAIEAARASGDPRFLGQAQAALTPWWTATDPPSAALLLRATLKQSQHDFDGALADLDRLLVREPASGQALLTRATVLTVRGNYADAQRDCRRLARLTTALVVTSCIAGPTSLSGVADDAYRALAQALARSVDPPGIRAWALTLAAEIAARRGDVDAADAHFREAFSLDPRDAYLRAAYADFLLDIGRPRDALPLLRDETRNDSLLLRLALAEQRLPDARASFDLHRADLAARFDAARARGDTLHQREEARFRLAIEGNAQAAVALARENWKVQREPADLRILAEAARAANDAAAQKIVDDWIANTRLSDVTLTAIRGARR